MWHISEVVQLAHYCSLVDISTEEMILVFNTTLKWLSFWVTFEEGNNSFNIRNLQALDLGFSEVLEWKGGMTSLGLWLCQVSDVVALTGTWIDAQLTNLSVSSNFEQFKTTTLSEFWKLSKKEFFEFMWLLSLPETERKTKLIFNNEC